MKKLFISIILLLSTMSMCGQVVKLNYSYDDGKRRLYNERTGRFLLTACDYDSIDYLGPPDNGRYYFKFTTNGRYGVFDDTGKVVVKPVWDDVDGIKEGFIGAKKNGNWGIIDLDGHSIISFNYQKVTFWDGTNVEITLKDWNNNLSSVNGKQLYSKRDAIIKSEREANERKIRQEQERIALEKKEKELSSFTEYARNYVEPKINSWQKKGEFEKIADYQARVTGPNRSAMIEQLTREAETLFISEHASLKGENAPMTLDVYDSENEVFHIKSSKLGEMIVPVPIADGPDFKAHFTSIKRQNPVYYINNDKRALASLEFYDPLTKKTYSYSDNRALNYNHYDLSPKDYTFEVVNVSSSKDASAQVNSSAEIKKPVVKILSPSDGGKYSSDKLGIRYLAQVFDGGTPTMKVWVNGEEKEFVKKPKGKTKGAVSAAEEIELEVPTDVGQICNIMLSITDSHGFASENETIRLLYAGDARKPTLHILSVGVSDYKSPSLTKLKYASKDAIDFVNVIKGQDLSMYGKLSEPILLTDSKATSMNIVRSLSSLVKQTTQDDVVMIFFSGHGIKDGNEAYYMAVDSDGEYPETGVDFETITKQIDKLTEKKCKTLLFMDTCHSGTMYGKTKGDNKPITIANEGVIGYYSSTENQTSAEYDAAENGAFTKALLDGLKGNAKNTNGEITADNLGQYIKTRVKKDSRNKQEAIVENKHGDVVLFYVKD